MSERLSFGNKTGKGTTELRAARKAGVFILGVILPELLKEAILEKTFYYS